MPEELFLQNFITIALQLRQLHIRKAWMFLNFMFSVHKLKCSLGSGYVPALTRVWVPPTHNRHLPCTKFSKLGGEEYSWGRGGLTSLPSAWCCLFHTAKPRVSLDIKPCWASAAGRQEGGEPAVPPVPEAASRQGGSSEPL